MMPANLFDHLGRPVRLGQELGRGGEAAVFEIAGVSDLVAKVYTKEQDTQKQAKLRAMIGLAPQELMRVTAWPQSTVHKGAGGSIIGFVMRKVEQAKEIHTLYSPAHRKITFPEADWRSLITTAMNCAAALENVHCCGMVMGDVNERNEFVSASGLVTLIDCDSFQI